jgi:hypothetical protein
MFEQLSPWLIDSYAKFEILSKSFTIANVRGFSMGSILVRQETPNVVLLISKPYTTMPHSLRVPLAPHASAFGGPTSDVGLHDRRCGTSGGTRLAAFIPNKHYQPTARCKPITHHEFPFALINHIFARQYEHIRMPSWTHLIRFVAVEDHQSHIGQLIDTSRDVGLDAFENREIKAYIINGTIFDGEVTKTVMTVKYVSIPHTPREIKLMN